MSTAVRTDQPAPPGAGERRYAVVVPVKPPAHGKSRLLGVDDAGRRALAAAFAHDTLAASRAGTRVGAVLVTTDDAWFAAALAAEGIPAVPDGASGDLNASLREAAVEAARRWPDLQPVALCADLPALRPADLDDALAAAASRADDAVFVADAAGTGTTLYTAPLALFSPRFGADSAAAHGDTAWPAPGPLTTLRRDVDDLEDLRAALALGVGARTAALVADLGLA